MILATWLVKLSGALAMLVVALRTESAGVGEHGRSTASRSIAARAVCAAAVQRCPQSAGWTFPQR